MADHLVNGCLFTVRTTNFFLEVPADEPCSTTVEQTTILKRGPFEMDRKVPTESLILHSIFISKSRRVRQPPVALRLLLGELLINRR